MYTIPLTGADVRLFDSPQRLPEYQRSLFGYYYAVHSGIGSTLADTTRHLETISMLIDADDKPAAHGALTNLNYLLYGLRHGQVEPNLLAMCCLIESVDGQRWDDYSEKALEALIGRLRAHGLSQQHAENAVLMYNQDINAPLIRDFPAHFIDYQQEAVDQQQRALLYLLDEIRDPDDQTLDVRYKSLLSDQIEAAQPPQMVGRGNVPDSFRVGYQQNKFLLMSEGLAVDDTTSAYNFWSLMSNLQDKYRRQMHRPTTPTE